MWTCINIEDNILDILKLQSLIEKDIGSLQLIQSFENSHTALSYIENCSKLPDLAFVDIELGKENGLQIAKRMSEIGISVIFLTSHNNFASEAFEISAIHYIQKPITALKLQLLLKRLSAQVSVSSLKQKPILLDKLVLNTQKHVFILSYNEIVLAEANRSYTCFKTIHQERIVVSKPLKEFAPLFESDKRFYRANRSLIINLDLLEKVTKNNKKATLQFKGGIEMIVDNFKLALGDRIIEE